MYNYNGTKVHKGKNHCYHCYERKRSGRYGGGTGGSGKKWVPCIFEGGFDSTPFGDPSAVGSEVTIQGHPGENHFLAFGCSVIPKYISNLRYRLHDADLNDYVTQVDIYGYNCDGRTTLFTETDDNSTIGCEDLVVNVDTSNYDYIRILFTIAVNTNGDFDMSYVIMEVIE